MGEIVIPKDVMDFLMGIQNQGIEEEAKWLAERTPFCNQGQIVILGDSITAQFPINEMDRTLEVYNRGISGDTTDGVLKRLKSNVLDLMPRQIFLMIGTNDIGNNKGTDYIFENIQKIIRNIKEALPSCEIYLHNVLHINKDMSVPPMNSVGCRTNETIDELNSKIAKIDGVKHIDLNKILSDNDGNLDANLSKDGLHLNYKGYLKVLNYIKPLLA